MKIVLLILAAAPLAACTNNEPVYIPSQHQIEIGVGTGSGANTGSDTMMLPYDQPYLTSTDYQKRQADLLASINAAFDPDITADQLPDVQLDETSIEIEWTVKNLDDAPNQAFIDVNGGNQYFYYNPDDFVVVDPNNASETERPPSLAGHVPIDVAASGTVSGVIREDELREAAIDVELVTRCAINPFAAILGDNSKIHSCADVPYVPFMTDPDATRPPAPPPLPIEAFGQLVRLDLTFSGTGHMVMEYAVRVRDPDGVLHTDLLAAPPGELMQYASVEYVPPTAP
jgi:hypothetical protein